MNEIEPARGATPPMTDTPERHDPAPRHLRRRPAADPRTGWDGDAAVQLLLASTAAGQTILDLDDDHVLRAAAATIGRHYRACSATPTRNNRSDAHGRPVADPAPADLVMLSWPRPDDTNA